MRNRDYKLDEDDLEKNEQNSEENQGKSNSWSLEKSKDLQVEDYGDDQIEILPSFYGVQTQRAKNQFNKPLRQQNGDIKVRSLI
ncbi:UNKNOWN [Stylonychia lemnae]|uniref:Uncharacterized protein n=1 Tax=Stylonychia lemnae TaxID=5949 RepID=A0A078AGG3_STYLE|nr:UNKNOWN [Stylonychia lemnae]|eukprot:CDW81329.1 UNKNOWN [Stylonychia lemnae]